MSIGTASMNWHLSIPGLRDDGGDCHFGDPRAEARHALEATVLAPLPQLGTLVARGPDTDTFLQGQLSNDLRKLSTARGQLSSYSSPKGRMLAVLHLLRGSDAVFLEIHAGVLPAVLKRLRLYVLRAKVTLDDASAQRAVMGIAGPGAAAALAAAGLPVPEAVLDACWQDTTCVLRRHDAGGRARYTAHAPVASTGGLWRALAAGATPAGNAAWRLLDIEAGVPVVYPQTSDAFVPQMCNLDRLGGISFDKGCYTGQEIVARIHYRGAVKRRMRGIDHPDPGVQPGQKLDDPAGAEVVDAAPAPGGGARLLAVVPD